MFTSKYRWMAAFGTSVACHAVVFVVIGAVVALFPSTPVDKGPIEVELVSLSGGGGGGGGSSDADNGPAIESPSAKPTEVAPPPPALAEDMPEDAERKGLGTPATRAATLEKLVSAGFVQRKKKQLIPTEKGKNLIAVLPDNIKSPILTAEWESMLKQVEHGELSATSFMDQIADMSRTLVKEHTTPEERFADLFPSSRGTAHEAVGVCPRCGAPVYEGKKGFFCDNRECSFALWKDNRFFSSKKKSITKSVAAALLKEGRISMSGLYSEKTGRTYDAVVVLDDTGGKYVNFKLEFPAKKGGRK